MRDGYLVLENGQVFKGLRFGEETSQPLGELVFTTAMTGYLETLTDPSFFGQMVVHCFPLIGNAGVIPEDFESSGAHLSATIAHQFCESPSNFRSEEPLDTWLKRQGVPAFSLPETRLLTRMIREEGVMAAALSHAPALPGDVADRLHGWRVQRAVEAVTRAGTQLLSEGEPGGETVVLWDFGAKASIAGMLAARGLRVVAVPAGATAEEILSHRPAGVLLSNGPGDPAENAGPIRQLQRLFAARLPLFGICLGHQLMALAAGARTRKMKFGHRGANQPVQSLATGRVHITSQNHGYCVVDGSLPPGAELLYRNVNDGSCEGIRYRSFPGFSVQFHPEARGGPLDTGFLFDEFTAMLKGGAAHA